MEPRDRLSNDFEETTTMTKMLSILTTVAVAVASAASKTHRVSITSPAWNRTNELKPEEYRLEIEGAHAVLGNGKTTLNSGR